MFKHIVSVSYLLQLLSYAPFVLSVHSSENFKPPMVNNILKDSSKESLRGINRTKWNDHIFEAQNLSGGIRVVGRDSLYDFPNSIMEIHDPCIQRYLSIPKQITIMIDGEKLDNCGFKYFSYTLENHTRIITDEHGTVISGVLDGRHLKPLHHLKERNIFTVGRQLVASLFEGKATKARPEALHTKCREDDLPLVMELAITFDSTLCEYFHKDKMYAFAAVYDMMYMAILPFHAKTCIRHKVVHVSGFCERSKDIYQAAVHSQNSVDFLDVLRSAWYSKGSIFSTVKRDLVYLLIGTGVVETRGSIRGGVCNKYNGFAWSGYTFGSSIISRELGHSFGAKYHDEYGYMTRDLNTPEELHNVKWFREISLRRFRKLIRSRGSCLLNGPFPDQHLVTNHPLYTCERWFRDDETNDIWRVPADKKWIDLGSKVTFVGNDIVVLHSQIFQSRIRFIMELRVGSSEFVIESYRRRPNMNNQHAPTKTMKLGPEIKVFKPTVLSYGATQFIRSEWTWAELFKPSNMVNCCDHRLFLDFELRLCKVPDRRTCEERFVQFALLHIECVTKKHGGIIGS